MQAYGRPFFRDLMLPSRTRKADLEALYEFKSLIDTQFWKDNAHRSVFLWRLGSNIFLTSSTCHPKIIREQRGNALMPFHEHCPADNLPVFWQGHLYRHDCLRKCQYLVNTHIYLGLFQQPFQFLVNLQRHEADTDMSLYPTPGEVEHRPYLYFRFRDAECPFNMPQVMICGIYFTGGDICIGKISFQPVPFRVNFKFVVIDGHLDVALHFQELVITHLFMLSFVRVPRLYAFSRRRMSFSLL